MVKQYWYNVLYTKSVPCQGSFGRVSRPALERSPSRTVGAQEKSSDKVFATSSSFPYIHTRGGIVPLFPSQAPTCARRRLHFAFPLCLLFPPAASERLTPEDRGRRRTTREGGRKRGGSRVVSLHMHRVSLSLWPFFCPFSDGLQTGSRSLSGETAEAEAEAEEEGVLAADRRLTLAPAKKGGKPKEEKGGRRRAFLVCSFFEWARKLLYVQCNQRLILIAAVVCLAAVACGKRFFLFLALDSVWIARL